MVNQHDRTGARVGSDGILPSTEVLQDLFMLGDVMIAGGTGYSRVPTLIFLVSAYTRSRRG